MKLRYPRNIAVRPFSRATYVLRFFWDGVPLVFWLALAWWFYGRIISLGLLNYLGVLGSAFLTLFTVRALRPVRKFILLRCYKLMVRTPLRPFIELGLWKLLVVAEYFWPGGEPDYAGASAFSQVYESIDPHKRWRRLQMLWHIDATAPPRLAKAARLFLRTVDAPLAPPA